MALFKLLTLLCIGFTSSHLFADCAIENHQIDNKKLERELKVLNKPPIKTIKMKEGDIIDCIEIYKQPTLDHPLFRNHTILLKPTSLPKNDKYKISATRSAQKMPGTVDCPLGTVPIRRTSKEDLIRAKSFFNKVTTNIHPLTWFTPGRHQAILTLTRPNTTYKGIESRLSVHNPSVQRGQSSSSQMWIEAGEPANGRNSLQVGWMVNPDLYGDNKTRTFGFWHINGGIIGNSLGCFNYLCPGFVQTSRNFLLGSVVPSHIDRTFHVDSITFRIIRDRLLGHWWLLCATYNVYVGYWPDGLLPLMHLQYGATNVVWGGQTFHERSVASPAMGSGVFPSDIGFFTGSSISKLKIVTDDEYLVDPDYPSYLPKKFVSNTKCYNLEDFTNTKGPVLDYAFLYGGPGGNNCGM